MSDSGGLFIARLLSIKQAGASSSTLGRARMGILCSRFVLGEPSLSQPSGGFLVCQRGPQTRQFHAGTSSSIRKPAGMKEVSN
jgi:hypothetical protein